MQNDMNSMNKTYRVLQLTDLHFTLFPTLFSFFPLSLNCKRLLGVLSLTVGGRSNRFNIHTQQCAVDTVHRLQPDLCIISGDISSTALDGEYRLAESILGKILGSQLIHTLVCPGNHDAYTKQAYNQWTIQQYFKQYMLGRNINTTTNTSTPHQLYTTNTTCTGITISTIDNCINIITLNPCRYSGIKSNGEYPQQQLDDLHCMLNDLTSLHSIHNNYNIVVTHYPVLDRKTQTDYGKLHYNHGVTNNHKLIELLNNATIKPNLIIHGHVHGGYSTRLYYNTQHNSYTPIYDPGSSGQTYVKNKRSAAFNIYNISHNDAGTVSTTDSHTHQRNPWHMNVQRYVYNGMEFRLEPEPYTSGY